MRKIILFTTVAACIIAAVNFAIGATTAPNAATATHQSGEQPSVATSLVSSIPATAAAPISTPAQTNVHKVTVTKTTMVVTLASDGDRAINLVKDGNVASVPLADIAAIVWNGDGAGWYPNHGNSAVFSASTATVLKTPSHDEGIWYVVLKDKSFLSINLDYVQLNGIPATRTPRNLIKY